MNDTLTLMDQIKDLYSQINKKTQFIQMAADKIGRSPKSLRNHWFSEFWSIPSEHQETVKILLKETIKNQRNE
jgi:hypothetical protein